MFDESVKSVSNHIDVHTIVDFCLNKENGSIVHSRKEKLLVFIWNARNYPFISRLAKYIPFKLQRYIKRILSKKPIHDLLKK